MEKFDTVDDYIASFSGETKLTLTKLRKKIKTLVSDAAESMSYGMPGYKLNGKPLVYFAAFKKHIGFFPTPSGIDGLIDEVKQYKTGKGTLQFPLDQPIPWDLVEKIVKFRVGEVEKSSKS